VPAPLDRPMLAQEGPDPKPYTRTYMSDTQMQFYLVRKSVEALGLRLNPGKPAGKKLEQFRML